MDNKPRRILLVDDYPDALAVWGIYLRMCGFEVLTTEDGCSAVELAHTSHPDLVILDLELPGISGLEVARRLRATVDTAAIPLIAVTGHSELPFTNDARDAGFDSILTKPCDPAHLLAAIDSLVPASNGHVPPPAT